MRVKILSMKGEKKNIDQLLTQNVEEVIEEQHLREILTSGRKLRIKLGIDPTSPDLHLGHAVALRKLRDFQDAGHTIILIVGDFTGMIGDPSGRNELRKPLTGKDVKENMKHYLAQAGKILNMKKVEVAYNNKWFAKEGIAEFVKLAAAGTFQQVLRRADFKKRIDDNQDITFLELLYPLFQGYDSVKVKADLEVGGTDQKFNLLTGRHVQRHFGMPEQDVMTFPLLVGLDGVKKMSKSLRNYIGLSDEPDDMFGKIMSVPDSLVMNYFALCTDLPVTEGALLKEKMGPKELKERLGLEIVKIYYGEKAGEKARENFERIFSKKEAPMDVPELKIRNKDITPVDIIILSGVFTSKSEARRLIEQGGFDINGQPQNDPRATLSFKGGEVIKVGKKRFFKVKIG